MTEGVAVFTSISDGSKPYFEAGFSKEDVIFISCKQSYSSKFIGYDGRQVGENFAKRVLSGG